MDIKTTLILLNVVLAIGTIYAWYQFYKVIAKKCDTCSVSLEASPFKSKCFVGAIFFSVAFLIAIYALLLV